MPVSLGEWRVRIGRFVHSVREYVIRERKEKLLKERIRCLRLLQKRLLEKKEKSEDERESKPNDMSVKVDNAPNESNIINSDTTNDTHKEERSRSESTVGDEYTFPFFFTLLLSLFSLLISLIFFFVFDFSISLSSYKSFLKWSYYSKSSWRIICLMIIIVCSSLTYFVLPYVIKNNAALQDNLVLIRNENAETESTNKVNNTPNESTIKENNTPTESAIGKNYTLSDSRTKDKNDTESAKECNSIQINATIKEINTSFMTRDGTLEIKQAKTNTSKRKTIKDKITPTELTIKENCTLPESTNKDNIAPKECHIDTRSTMTDNPSKRKTTKGKKTVTESTYKSNTTMTESTIKDNNTQNRSAIKVSITKAESTIKESSNPSTIKDKSPKRKISRSKTTKEKNIATESHIKENNITIGYTIDRKSASTESAIKINNPTATSVNKGGYISTECTIKNSNARTKSTNNASSESTIKKKNTPTECTIKVHNTTAERTINCNDTKTESIIKDRQLKTEFTIKDYNRSGESTMTDTKTPYEPTIKDYNTCIELSTNDNNSAIQCAIKEKNTPFESDIKENKTPSRTPTEDNNNQTMKVNIAQAEYTIRSGIQKVLSDGKHSISGQIPSSLKGTTNDSVMQESTCLPEMILIKAGDVELNPGPFERSATIQEQELVNLAYDVPSSKYTELCIALGVSYNQSQAILDRHHLDFTRSLIAIFCEWKNRQRDGTDCRQDIAAALRGVHLDALGDKMSGGGYLPQEAAPTESTVGEKNPPLTKEQVYQCAQDFRTFYRTRLCKIKTDPLDFNSILEFERIYTNLVLLRNEMGTTRKTPLDYTKLLTTKVNAEFPKRLMVEGEGGAGKTTFCSKIAWDWANGTKEFEEFDWVLVIPFCNTIEGQTVGDIAKTYLFHSNTVQPRQIDNYILSAPLKVFIIFDGLDEYAGNILQESSDIAKILRSEMYVGCRVLVTTRPWRAVPFKSHKTMVQTFAFLAIAGFDRESISTYITKYFQDEPPAGYELIKYIESNDLIQENMAPFPLFIAMLCILWRNSDADKLNIIRKLKTFSQLLTAMMIFLKDHCLAKQHQNPNVKTLTNNEINNYLLQIGKFAYSGVVKKRLTYTEHDFSGYDEAMEACCRIGVLSREILIVPRQDMRLSETDPVTWSVFFPHRFIQEYLVGMYLASLFESDHERYEEAISVVIPRVEEFRHLLYFTASQTKNVAIDVTNRLINMTLMSIDKHTIVDVAFEAYDEDAAKVVAQQLFAKRKSLIINDKMSAHTVSGYIFIMDKITVETLILSRSCGPTVSRDLADVICSSTSLTALELSGTALHDDFYGILESKVKTSQIEKLCVDCNLKKNDPTASRALAKFLCLLRFLTDLRMKDSHNLWLHDDFYHELAVFASSSKIQKVLMGGRCLEYNDGMASRNLARFLCVLPCLTDLTITDSQESPLWLSEDFYQEIALRGPSSMNNFFNKKLHMDESSEKLRQMDLRQQSEYIGHLLHPTLSEITPRPTSKAPEPLSVTPPELDVPSTSAKSDKLPEVSADINIQEAIREGEAPWNRSRIMVIGPAGVGKTSLIRRLTRQDFNPDEKSTKGAEQNVVTQSAVSSWVIVNDAKTAKGDLIKSLATMDPSFGSNRSCSTGGEENRSDPATTETRGVEHEHVQETTQETPSTSSQQQMTKENVVSTQEHRHASVKIADEVPTESKRIQDSETGSSQSSKGNENISEATKDESSEKVLPTSDNDQIAEISKHITREEITKVKSSALDITYSIWDFGGQEIYYITHPLFLSWRSLYILVIPLHLELSDKAPREEDALKQLKGSPVRTPRTILELVDFWLMSVYTHAVRDSNHEPKVLLIGTFAGDEGPGIIQEKVAAKFQELKDRLGSKPYWKQVLSPMCGIDNQFSSRSEVEKIQERIDGLVKDSAYMKVLMPIKWRTYLSAIEDSDQKTLTVTEADSTMKTFEINGDKEVKAVLKFYHDIGHLIYHQGCELVVLKPQFLNNIVSNIITVIDDEKMKGDRREYWRDLKEKGILSIELIQAVWEKHKGHHDQLNDIINMMIMFDLICEIPDRPDGRRFFVPCRSSSMLDEKECHFKDDKVEFIIDFNHFLPDGFLHRFYVRMAKWSMERKKSIKPTFHCRQMMFYIDNRHRVVMTNEIHSEERHQIKVTIYAVAPAGTPSERTQTRVSLNKNIIDHLHDTLEDLKMLWARRIEYSVGILCPNCSEHGGKKLIPIRDILEDQDVDGLASCDDGCPVYVGDILKAFSKGTKLPWEKQGYSSIGVHVDAANSSSVTGNTFIGQQNITKHSLYSHGSEVDSLGEPSTSTKRVKKTNRKTDSTTDEDEITRRDKRTMGDGSEDDSLGGRPRKRKKKTNRQTDSSDEDGRARGDKQTIDTVSDVQLNTLAARIPHDKYHHLSDELGIEYNEASRILKQHGSDSKPATRECLSVWKYKTGGSFTELNRILNSVHLGDKYHSEGIFDQTGGELHIASYGLTLSIPPGALPEGSSERITLDVLTDIPPEITLRLDETLVSFGFQCLPSGLQFESEKPVRLKMPHCANLIDPRKVQVVLYSLNHEGEAARIVQTSRTCQVTYSHVEISLEHFSKGYMAMIKDFFTKYKRMSFMPFLPKIMPQCRKMMLQFRMVTKPHTIYWRDVHEIREKAEYQPAKDDDDEMNVKHKDLEVTCQLDDNDTLKQNINASFIKETKHTLYFELDFNGKADDELVTLKVIQSKLQMDIKFRTHFLASLEMAKTSSGKTDSASPRPSASTSVDIPPQGASAEAGEASTSKARPTEKSSDQDFDGLLKTVANRIDKDIDIDNLGLRLGFEPSDIKRYLQKNNQDHSYMGTLHMLRDWRNKTTRSEEREQLKKALIAIDQKRLADELLSDDMAS